ncbi:TetR/AcrR family transcriptional regulator [Rhodococcus sp. NCIMB 12038]|jgi:AcrR family transcriptional regulator|uniref:TetR/AcrR family transcriptional regulator n=1 Tax=Rhodococcus sp. NCIMB 12038 TaxID=933800 RepID=UPI001C4F4CB8|nr:TetR/AcrR family transcriptional regulator [Rhodococcus sp. NCIMB 12038]
MCGDDRVWVLMGAPRGYDEDRALEGALRLFWLRGYEGASLAGLLCATGLNRASFYRVFDSKEDLFARAVERYRQKYLSFRDDALAEHTPRRIVEKLLHGLADLHTDLNTPPGCLETNATLSCSESDDVRLELIRSRDRTQAALEARFAATMRREPLPPGMTPAKAAFFVSTVVQGMAVQVKHGTSRRELRDLVDSIVASW